MKQVVTISGIRPDFIRMSHVFDALDGDPDIEHIMIHTGQHYDTIMSDVFFKDLNIRRPDFNLRAVQGTTHPYALTHNILRALLVLIRKKDIQPDLFLFLGDSNSVCCAVELKKLGYKIGHIEAGMRSYDDTMLEETNRVVCDHCSDILFVYHPNYAEKLEHEGITENVHIVGNTILEPAIATIIEQQLLTPSIDLAFPERLEPCRRAGGAVYVDIHRPENFKSKLRMVQILCFCKYIQEKYAMTEIRWVNFPRTMAALQEYGIKLTPWGVTPVPMMSYIDFMREQAHCKFLISDSGTAQEEAALVNCPVIVPRDFTERPESVEAGCSYMLDLGITHSLEGAFKVFTQQAEQEEWERACSFAENAKPLAGARWLYHSQYNTPSQLIVKHIKEFLHV